MMTWNEFVSNVQDWQRSRGIYEHSTSQAQTLKAISELGELADAIIKDDRDALVDAIGDVAVCLVGVATMNDCVIDEPVPYYGGDDHFDLVGLLCKTMHNVLCGLSVDPALDTLASIAKNSGLDFTECCESAYNEIKDRKGKMVAGGAFIKEE